MTNRAIFRRIEREINDNPHYPHKSDCKKTFTSVAYILPQHAMHLILTISSYSFLSRQDTQRNIQDSSLVHV